MMIYLCARYSRRDELRDIRNEILLRTSHTVHSQWLDTEWTEDKKVNEVGSSAAPLEYREKYALADLEDVTTCDYLVAFTEEPRSNVKGAGRGGRHVEFGVALALGKRIIVVGPRENLFYYHPKVEVVADAVALIDKLRKE